jgi:hypothetical protein
MISNPRKLRVQPGDEVKAEHHNGLVELAESLTWQRGRLRGRRLPDGFIPHIPAVTSATMVTHPWAVEIEEGKEGALSLIDGVVPEIDGRPLDDFDEKGEPPRLQVAKDAWAKRGNGERSLLMLRYHLTQELVVGGVAPVAVASVPPAADYVWHKLLGFLLRFGGEVRYRPQCFFSQNFVALAGRSAGRFQPLPRVA